MANRVNVDINANVTGFTQGMKQATDSAKKYTTETRKISDSLGNFRKDFANAKREALNLAQAYSQLSKEAKNSQFGKEMKRQLDEATAAAANMRDLQSDLNEQMKNMASDTRAFDTISEAMGVVATSTSAAMGVVAQFTGNEEDAKKAVVMFTTATSALAAAQKIQTALQKQSNIMLAVSAVQSKAAELAERARTSSIIGATAAQKAFNIVAKANPYVLLATAALAAVGAIVAFTSATNNATSAQEQLKQMMHDTAVQGQKDAVQETTKLDLLYAASQDVNLSMEDRRKAVDKLQSEYPSYFGNMSQEAILAGQASDAYRQLAADIITVAEARAYSKKLQEQVEARIEKEDRLEKLDKEIQKQKELNKENIKYGRGTVGSTGIGWGQWSENQSVGKQEKEYKKLEQEIEDNKIAEEELKQAILDRTPVVNKMTDANNGLANSYDDLKNKLASLQAKARQGLLSPEQFEKEAGPIQKKLNELNKAYHFDKQTGGGKTGKIDTKPITDSIGDIEKKITELQDKAKKGLLPDEMKNDPEKYKAALKGLQAQLKDLKIKWGFEEPETQLQTLQKKITESEKKYILAVEADDQSAKEAALQEYYTAQDALNKYKLSITIEPKISEAEVIKQKDEISKIVQDAYKPEEQKFDFSGLSESAQKEANATLEQFNRIKDARDKLNEIIENKDKKYGAEAVDSAREAIVGLTQSYNELGNAVDAYNEKSKDINNTRQNIEGVGQALSDLGSIMSSIGSISENKIFNATAIIAQAVATYILGWTEATAKASKLGPVGWAAFGLSTAAQALAVIAQIKNVAKFAHGGIVGGNSYSGDRMLAQVNSGEMILNQKQQSNLFNMIDTGSVNNTANHIEFGEIKLRGSDLYITYKNYEKTHSISQNKNIRV